MGIFKKASLHHPYLNQILPIWCSHWSVFSLYPFIYPYPPSCSISSLCTGVQHTINGQSPSSLLSCARIFSAYCKQTFIIITINRDVQYTINGQSPSSPLPCARIFSAYCRQTFITITIIIISIIIVTTNMPQELSSAKVAHRSNCRRQWSLWQWLYCSPACHSSAVTEPFLLQQSDSPTSPKSMHQPPTSLYCATKNRQCMLIFVSLPKVAVS